MKLQIMFIAFTDGARILETVCKSRENIICQLAFYTYLYLAVYLLLQECCCFIHLNVLAINKRILFKEEAIVSHNIFSHKDVGIDHSF